MIKRWLNFHESSVKAELSSKSQPLTCQENMEIRKVSIDASTLVSSLGHLRAAFRGKSNIALSVKTARRRGT